MELLILEASPILYEFSRASPDFFESEELSKETFMEVLAEGNLRVKTETGFVEITETQRCLENNHPVNHEKYVSVYWLILGGIGIELLFLKHARKKGLFVEVFDKKKESTRQVCA